MGAQAGRMRRQPPSRDARVSLQAREVRVVLSIRSQPPLPGVRKSYTNYNTTTQIIILIIHTRQIIVPPVEVGYAFI